VAKGVMAGVSGTGAGITLAKTAKIAKEDQDKTMRGPESEISTVLILLGDPGGLGERYFFLFFFSATAPSVQTTDP
jgi:hypothetical protein